MNTRQIIIFITFLMIIVGCSDNYHVMIRNWVGTREAYLINGWGVPDKTHASGKSKFLTYHLDGGSPSGCTTTFEIVDGFVDSFEYDGKGCVGDFNTYNYNKN